MASACVNISLSPDTFRNIGWPTIPDSLLSDPASPSKDSVSDFEFHLINDSVTMLPADQLFFDGKLLPLHFPNQPTPTSSADVNDKPSPKAPRCSSRWREILGLKNKKTTPKTNETQSIKQLLQKKPKSSDTSLTMPLIDSRLSLSSSSSSGHDYDDLPRFSLDDKPRDRLLSTSSRPRLRLRPLIDHPSATVVTTRGVSMDSPRMNPAGKVVFQSLGRSSSSPSSFNGGPRYKYRGMERSYSANVRVTPVLNVPVCSLRGSSKSGSFGFGHLFSSSSSSSSSSSLRKDKESITSHRRKGSS